MSIAVVPPTAFTSDAFALTVLAAAFAGATSFCATAGTVASSPAAAIANIAVMRMSNFLSVRSNRIVRVTVVVAAPPHAGEPE
jgi:hypothetical protein